ncbi:MAG: glycerophosphodiester phosphodiesterase [Myxococcota bacterium]
MKPYLRTLPRFAHTAHRGGALVAPENTLAAFQQAVRKWRTDILELDVRPSREGHVMVIHDDTLDRTTNGRGPVSALTLRELQALDAGWHMPGWRGQGVTIPTLEEVLRAFPDKHINIELKVGDAEFQDAFAALIRRRDAVERVCIGHVDVERAAELQTRLPQCAYWYPEEAVMLFVMSSRGGAELPREERFDLLSIPWEFGGTEVVDRKLVEDAHALGKALHVWTVDERPMMEKLMDLGVDGILTDRPDLLRDVMSARSL